MPRGYPGSTPYKACTECGATLKRDTRYTCGGACFGRRYARLYGETQRPGRASHNRQAVQARCIEMFGPLTAREVALFNFASKVGYTRGYYAHGRRLRGDPNLTLDDVS